MHLVLHPVTFGADSEHEHSCKNFSRAKSGLQDVPRPRLHVLYVGIDTKHSDSWIQNEEAAEEIRSAGKVYEQHVDPIASRLFPARGLKELFVDFVREFEVTAAQNRAPNYGEDLAI